MVNHPCRHRAVLGLLARTCIAGIVLLWGRPSRAEDAVEATSRAVAAKVGGAVKLEQRCDPAGEFLLFSQPATGWRYLAHLEGSHLALSQPLTGRHDSRGAKVECRTSPSDAYPRDDGYCNSACAYDASGLKYFYARYHDSTRQETATGRERTWFVLELQDGLFLTRSVSRLVSTNLSIASHWQTQRYEEQIDFQARRFSIRYRRGTDRSNDEPKFEATSLPAVAQGRLLVAGSTFDPALAFTDLQAVHGKEQLEGSSDLSASLMARWDRDSLSFRVTVKDDVVRLGPGLHSDHLELWSGPAVFSVLGLRQKAAPEDRQLMIAMVDGKVLATVAHPESSDPPRPLEGRYETSPDGYVVEFTIPAALLISRPGWSDYDSSVGTPLMEGDLLPFTLVISDSDREGRQQSLSASSSLKWGDPVTFGRILLVGDHRLPELNRSAAREEL